MIQRGGLERGLKKSLNGQLHAGFNYGLIEAAHEAGRRIEPDLLPTIDYTVVVDKNRDKLVNLAEQASHKSPHYDGTRFGGAALALCETWYGLQYFDVYPTSNRSKNKGDDKSCAEMGADALSRWHYSRTGGGLVVVSMAVFGPSDPDRIFSITGTSEFDQCTPCHDCLGRLATNPACMYDTEVISANENGYTTHMLGNLIIRAATIPRPLASGQLQAAA